MVTNRLMWRAIFSRFSHLCAVTVVLDDLMFGVGVDMLSGMDLIVVVTPAIFLELVVAVWADVPADWMTVLTIDFMFVIEVGMLTDENLNGLAVVMTPLEFTLSAS